MGDVFLLVALIGLISYNIVDRICEYLEKKDKEKNKLNRTMYIKKKK